MDVGHVVVPLRVGGKKMKKRRELDALVAHSLAKRACSGKKQVGNGITSQDQLLSQSTDDQEESTWSKLPITTTRCRTKRFTCLRSCGLMVLMTSVLILFGLMYWLYFDLRQQIYDHRIKIEQVSAASHILPDALQKWHMTSKALEANQTNIYNKLSDMHKSLTSFEKELSDVRDEINRKNVDSNNEKLAVLEGNVANFGAKITDLTFNVAGLKEHLYTVQAMDMENKKNLSNLAREFSFISRNYTQSSDLNIETIQTMIRNVSDSFASDLKNMSHVLSSVNDTLSQRTKGSDDDLNLIKPKVDVLIENFANMSSHVMSIEDDWTKFKQKAFDFEENSNQINSEILRLKNNTDHLASSVGAIEMDNAKKRTDVADSQSQSAKNQTYTSANRTPPNLAILLSAAATDASAGPPLAATNTSTIQSVPIITGITTVSITKDKSNEAPNSTGKPKLLRIQRN